MLHGTTVFAIPHRWPMNHSYPKNVEAVFGQGSSLVKTDHVQLSAYVNPVGGQCTAFELSQVQMDCLWGLMQKICFFFSRDRAKLVPMDKVAGRAGGTTIVIKSKARTTIRCHASYTISAQIRIALLDTLTLSLTKFTKEAMKPIAATPAMTDI